MGFTKSLDNYKVIAAALRVVHTTHGVITDKKNLRLDLLKAEARFSSEGMGFLTKTLPRLAKALDRVLAGQGTFDSSSCGFKPVPGSKLPRFLGTLFARVLSPDGEVLQEPCVESIRRIRQVCFMYYKYKLPYSDEQEQQVIQRFERTEDDLSTVQQSIERISQELSAEKSTFNRRKISQNLTTLEVAREAKILLSSLFAFFDPKDIHPRHGPGAVATKQQLWEKYQWKNISAKITDYYPLDQYFFAGMGHVCDRLQELQALGTTEFPARVVLVPKDSRGPRLISAEPVDYQWIQQGLGQAIVELAERHPLTRDNVRFTDQCPNQRGALLGSMRGKYATIDLNEASDRVSVSLVRLLFPPQITEALEACRTSSTRLPNGKEIKLKKFAPMGSSLCFPILALTVWAILAAGYATDRNCNLPRDIRDKLDKRPLEIKETAESIYVYGDDVIVPTAYAANAIERLEAFGLKVNKDKSCTSGLFRESCGVDAYKGENVTPVRIRTVWSSEPSPDVYTSWIAYANAFYDRQYFEVYDYIVEELHRVYGCIPDCSMHLTCPSLREVAEDKRPKRSRINKRLQKRQILVRDVKTPAVSHEIDGWSMLQRFFVEKHNQSCGLPADFVLDEFYKEPTKFSVCEYTRRRSSMLVRRWR